MRYNASNTHIFTKVSHKKTCKKASSQYTVVRRNIIMQMTEKSSFHIKIQKVKILNWMKIFLGSVILC